jgi:hypothetical protein
MTLGKLFYEQLEKIPAWRVIPETIDEVDVELEPATFDNVGLIETMNGEVWCLCKATFSNGDEHKASAMYRGDANEGPFFLSVFNGSEGIPLIMPPAPTFVLGTEFPEAFCKKFNKAIQEVFPIFFSVIPKFKTEPQYRSILINL